MNMKSMREILEESKRKTALKSVNESAIPSFSADETIFEVKSRGKYLIVFVDIVDSTSKLRVTDMNLDALKNMFGVFYEKTISSFRKNIGNYYKFKMMGDGLLFFVPIKTIAGELLANGNHYEKKCNKFHDEISNSLSIRTIAGYGELIEFDVGLHNGWTDYFGIAINNIVHASKDIEGEFKWVQN